MNCWLMKTEPNAFSIDDLAQAGVEPWDGIRNYQARNFMRDDMKVGDRVFIYHSRIAPVGIVGEGEIASKPYPDPTQFDVDSNYFDPKSDPASPRWMLVDVCFVCKYEQTLELQQLKNTPGLENMMVIQKGSRLSIQPVKAREWRIVQTLAGYSAKV